jgi:hypothetical protein
MLRWMDGADAMDSNAYNASSIPGGNLKYYGSLQTFLQCAMVGGRFGGQALNPFNTSSGEANWTRVFDAQSQWCGGFALQLTPGAFASNDPLFYRLESGGPSKTVVGLAYESSTGKLEIWRNGTGTNGGKGTLVLKTSIVLSQLAFSYFEVFCIVNGVNSTLQLWQDDVNIADYGPSGASGTINLGTDLIDRATFRWESGGTPGYYWDDYYLTDGQGVLNNTRLGPCRVMSSPPIGDAFTSFWTRNTGTTDFGCVDEYPPGAGHGVPDFDVTYLNGTASCSDLFNFATPACVGRVLGVAVNAVLKGLPPASVALLCKPIPSAGSAITLASLSPPGNGTDWACLQAITESDLATGANNWTDGDIGRAWWGAGLSSGSAHFTQIYLEKLVSLRSVSFDCGALGSYAV